MTTVARRIALGHVLAAVVSTASCGSASTSRTPAGPASVAPPPRRIVVLGDSLALSPSSTQNFPAELQSRVERFNTGWIVANASVSGDTTSGGLRRFDAAMTADTSVLVLALGANDGLRGVDVATIESNLSTLIERAQARGIEVLLCGMETPPTRGWDYTVEYHRMFRRLAERHTVSLVPFLLAGVALNPELNGEDGIHPNASGAKRIAETVWPYLEALLRAEMAEAGSVP